MKVVVVGASTGLGRCLAVGLAQRGNHVALLARSTDLIESAAAEAGNGAVAIRCDVTDAAECRSAVVSAAEALGGIDAVVYAPGIGTLSRIEDIEPDTWHRMFATNVVGASTVAAAALPYLKSSSGMMAFLTSVSASVTATWPGLASYTVTKASLDKLVEAWRAEHPDVGFTRLIVGECGGGEGAAQSQFAAGWDLSLAGEFYPMWTARGLLTDKLMDIEHFVNGVAGVLQCGASMTIPTVAFTPRRPI